MYTIDDINAMTDAQKAALKRKAVLNIAGFVAVKIGITVAIHYAVKSIVKSIDSRESAESTQQ